jgi:Escherichia/Staphylococcus phage prohead protease
LYSGVKMKNKIERRIFKAQEFRVKKNDDGENILEGYSAVFDLASDNLGWGDWEVREFIAPGAFTEALKKSDCRALFNHDPNFVLGRESAKTLTLVQDERGLKSTIILPDTTVAKDLAVSVERGDIKEQSFAFIVLKDAWEEDRENKKSVRTILEIKELLDISPVTYPAYPDTDIAKRSFENFRSQSGENPGDDIQDLENKAQEKELDENIINLLFED